MRKRFTILGSLIVILSLVLLLKTYIFPLVQAQKSNTAFPFLTKDAITHMIIEDGTTADMLYKKDDQWFLEKDHVQYKADTNRITPLLEAVVLLKKDDPVSTNKQNHAQFGIDKRKITYHYDNILGKTGDIVLYIGNKTQDLSSYVRVDSENEVYTAPGFTDAFSSMDYRDMSLHFITSQDDVSSVHVEYDDISTLLTKANDSWQLDDKKADGQKADFYIGTLQTLVARDVVDPATVDLNSLDDDLTITVKENDTDKTADFYKLDDDNYYVKLSTSDKLYKLSSTTVENLKKAPEDFLTS